MASISSPKPKKPSLIGGILVMWIGIILLVLGVWWEYWQKPMLNDDNWSYQYLGLLFFARLTYVH